MKSYELKNGITVHFVPDTKFKTYGVGVFFHQPITEETVTKNALLPMLLKRGSVQFPSAQAIASELERLYGASFGADIMKKGEDHIAAFYLEGVSNAFVPEGEDTFQNALRLLFDVILHANCPDGAFPSDVLRQEKENLKHIIEGIVNDKRTYAVERTIETMFSGEPFGLCSCGKIEALDSITPEEMYAHYQTVLNESAMDIFILGYFDETEATALLSELCGSLAPRNSGYPKITLKQAADEKAFTQESLPIAQGKLAIGFTTGISGQDEDYYALMMFNSIFGSGTHSKLFCNVREKLSLAYYAVSRLYQFKGMMMVDSGIEFENYQKTVDEIFLQLEEMKRGNISEVEYHSAIESLCNSLRSLKDSMGSTEQYYLSQVMLGTNRTPEETIERLRKVTVSDIVRVAQNVQPHTVYFLKN